MSPDSEDADGGRRDLAVAGVFVSLASRLVEGDGVVDLMDQLVTSCVALFDIAAAGLLLVDEHGGLQVAASSSEEARVLELFQLQADEGPCLDCVRTAAPVMAEELD